MPRSTCFAFAAAAPRPGSRLARRRAVPPEKPITAEDRRALGVPPAERPEVPAGQAQRLGPQPDRRASSWRRSRTNGLEPCARGRPADAAPPAQLRPDRPAADARGGRRVRRRPLAGCLREASSIACWRARTTASAGRSTGSTWRATPTPTASSSTRPARRLALSRLGGRGAEPRHALRPVRRARSSPATSSAPTTPSAFIATGFNRCYPDMVDLNDQRLRRQNALERHHRDDRPGLPGPDDRLRPLPRPQVRPDPPGRLLPAPGVLHPGAVPRRLPARLDRRTRRPTSEQSGRLGSARSRGFRRPDPRSSSRSREPLAPGPARGSNDETAAAFTQAGDRADAGGRPPGLRRAQPSDRRISAEAWAASSTRLGAVARRSAGWRELDAAQEGRPAQPAHGPRGRRDRPASRRRPTSCAGAIIDAKRPRGRAGVPLVLCSRRIEPRPADHADGRTRPAGGRRWPTGCVGPIIR